VKGKGKKIQGMLSLQVPAGKANPAPPIGSALGQRGVNIMEFCKQFNDATKDIQPGTPTPVVMTIYTDKTFSFITKSPPTSYLILKGIGKDKGSKEPGKDFVGTLSNSKLEEIAKMKMKDMGVVDIEAAKAMVAGTAVSMGIKVES
jgi:large subunit ribosomal protein L11